MIVFTRTSPNTSSQMKNMFVFLLFVYLFVAGAACQPACNTLTETECSADNTTTCVCRYSVPLDCCVEDSDVLLPTEESVFPTGAPTGAPTGTPTGTPTGAPSTSTQGEGISGDEGSNFSVIILVVVLVFVTLALVAVCAWKKFHS